MNSIGSSSARQNASINGLKLFNSQEGYSTGWSGSVGENEGMSYVRGRLPWRKGLLVLLGGEPRVCYHYQRLEPAKHLKREWHRPDIGRIPIVQWHGMGWVVDRSNVFPGEGFSAAEDREPRALSTSTKHTYVLTASETCRVVMLYGIRGWKRCWWCLASRNVDVYCLLSIMKHFHSLLREFECPTAFCGQAMEAC